MAITYSCKRELLISALPIQWCRDQCRLGTYPKAVKVLVIYRPHDAHSVPPDRHLLLW